jgi:hypothetical protein
LAIEFFIYLLGSLCEIELFAAVLRHTKSLIIICSPQAYIWELYCSSIYISTKHRYSISTIGCSHIVHGLILQPLKNKELNKCIFYVFRNRGSLNPLFLKSSIQLVFDPNSTFGLFCHLLHVSSKFLISKLGDHVTLKFDFIQNTNLSCSFSEKLRTQ